MTVRNEDSRHVLQPSPFEILKGDHWRASPFQLANASIKQKSRRISQVTRLDKSVPLVNMSPLQDREARSAIRNIVFDTH